MGSRDERLAENQRTFRRANERLQELARVADGTVIPFLCECADLSCLGRVEASIGEFEVIHEDDDRFFIVPGHPRMDGERVIDHTDRYEVVTKADTTV
jgi:hypothetical protein